MATSQWIPLQKQLVPKAKDLASQYQRNARRRHKEAIENALKKGYLRFLDAELILDSQLHSEDATELQDVLRISLSGSHVQAIDDIAILSCSRLRLCSLESCYINDITAFYGCVNLLKLDVSNNQIVRLPPYDFWASLTSLRVLYLNGNAIAISGQENLLSRLNSCPQLHVLTLHDTPLSLMKNYRHHVVNSILSLRALDQYVISDEEIIENLHVSERFKPITSHCRLQLYQSFPKGTTYREELRSTYHLLLNVDTVLARHSPVIIIQRWVRGWMVRKALAKSPNQHIRFLVQKKPKNWQTSPARRAHMKPGSRVIAAQVPHSSVQSEHKRKTGSLASFPPPPPTTPIVSPRREHVPRHPSIETHVLGMDVGSSKLRYSMHINLQKLQQNVREAEDSEPEGVNKEFKSAFQRRTTKKATSRATKQKKYKVEIEKVLPKVPLPSKEVDSSLTLGGRTEQESLPQTKDDVKDKQKDKLKAPVDEVESAEIDVTGQTVQALPHNYVTAMLTSRREDGRMIRNAEKDIKEAVTKKKQPPPRPENPNAMKKDEMAFTRAYATMTLSALQAVERAHEAQKRAEVLIHKANLVSKAKQERVERQGRIREFHKAQREDITAWKMSEEARLAHLREQQHVMRTNDLLEASESYDTTAISTQRQMEDKMFACNFNQQQTLVSCTLSHEDRKQSKDVTLQEIKERIQQAREVSKEHQEMVKKYMELREAKLLREGVSAKRQLDTKMLEAATQHLMEARKKVAREIARKQAAKAAIALAKEELRNVDTIPQYPQTAVRMDLTSTELVQEKPTREGTERQNRIPVAMRKMNRESHRTWQRGTHVMMDRQAALASQVDTVHFPLLSSATDDSPLMYEMMRPGPMLRSMTTTPIDSVTESSSTSPGGSMLLQQLTVR